MFNIFVALLSLTALYFTAREIVGDWFPLFNGPAFLLVLLGIVFIGTFLLGVEQFPVFFKKAFELLLGKQTDFEKKHVDELVELAEEKYQNSILNYEKLGELKDDFLKRCLTQKLESTLGPESMGRVFTSQAEDQYQVGMSLSQRLRMLAKFCPGLGLFGALLALIGYTGHLDKALTSRGIGELLMICLYCVLYGFFFANFIFAPLADRLELQSEREYKKNNIIAHGLYLLFSGMNPGSIEAELKSYSMDASKGESGE
jgi:chemotaxis protein MotA